MPMVFHRCLKILSSLIFVSFLSDNGGSWGHLWNAVLDFSCMSSGVNVRSTYDYLLTYLYYCFCNANLCTIPMIVRQTIILVENLIVIPCTPWYLYVLQLLIDYFFAGCKLQGWQVHRVSIDDICLHSRLWQEQPYGMPCTLILLFFSYWWLNDP